MMSKYFAITPDGSICHRQSTDLMSYAYAIATRGHKISNVTGWHCLHWCTDKREAEELTTKLANTWAEVVVVEVQEEI